MTPKTYEDLEITKAKRTAIGEHGLLWQRGTRLFQRIGCRGRTQADASTFCFLFPEFGLCPTKCGVCRCCDRTILAGRLRRRAGGRLDRAHLLDRGGRIAGNRADVDRGGATDRILFAVWAGFVLIARRTGMLATSPRMGLLVAANLRVTLFEFANLGFFFFRKVLARQAPTFFTRRQVNDGRWSARGRLRAIGRRRCLRRLERPTTTRTGQDTLAN